MKTLEQQAVTIIKALLERKINLVLSLPNSDNLYEKLDIIDIRYNKRPIFDSHYEVVTTSNTGSPYKVSLNTCYHRICVKDYLGYYLPVLTVNKDTVINNISDIMEDKYGQIYIQDIKFIARGHFLNSEFSMSNDIPILDIQLTETNGHKYIIYTPNDIITDENIELVYSYFKI